MKVYILLIVLLQFRGIEYHRPDILYAIFYIDLFMETGYQNHGNMKVFILLTVWLQFRGIEHNRPDTLYIIFYIGPFMETGYQNHGQ